MTGVALAVEFDFKVKLSSWDEAYLLLETKI